MKNQLSIAVDDKMSITLKPPSNEPLRSYSCLDRDNDRNKLILELETISKSTKEIPLIINGEEIWTEDKIEILAPHNKDLILAIAHLASEEEIQSSIDSSIDAREKWAELDQYERSVIFQKAASLLSGSDRILNIATIMMNLSKNPYEAEIDLVELIDFWNYNSYFAEDIFNEYLENEAGESNRYDWRPLEGFILAISPFNFYSISGNLPTAPALIGNSTIWKPSSSVILSSFEIMRILIKAGLPPGVINFLPFRSENSKKLIKSPNFSGLHFTGSYQTFIKLWKNIAQNIDSYHNFPRIVGETGGKNFIIAHPTANIDNFITNLIRGAFGFQGQKCSAVSRAYIPKSLWSNTIKGIRQNIENIRYGDVMNLKNYGGAIINEKSHSKIVSYINHAMNKKDTYKIIFGGNYKSRNGYFVDPTMIRTFDPNSRLMREEIFGPILTVYVYDDDEYSAIVKLCDNTSPYGLTGAIFATNRDAINEANRLLRYSAGNFYINDKPTGAIVGRQPFGGSRHSGTNDKAGSKLNLYRWLQPRVIKETFIPNTDWKRPYLC